MLIIHHVRRFGKFCTALQIGNGAANIQQYPFGEGTGGFAQNEHSLIGGKVTNGCKIIQTVKLVSIVAAAGQYGVGDAVAHQLSQLDSQVYIRQFCQKTVAFNLMYFLEMTL